MAASSAKYLVRGVILGTISTAAVASIWSKSSAKKDIDIEYQEGQTKQTPPEYLKRASEILRFGSPDCGTQLRFYRNHVLAYDQAKKIPIWVAEHLTAENRKGKANRKKSFFKPDPDVHEFFRSDNSDFLKSGWSRGHMAPAGNNKIDQTAMDETFLLSNILPQDFDNNSGFWNRFEMYCRDLTKTYSDVYVVSGPLFLAHEENGKRFVKYQVIGENEVAVPTHLYKVLVAEDRNRNLQLGAFIVPNKPIDSTHKLAQFQVPLHNLEIKSGLKFLKNLDVKYQNLCAADDGCNMISDKELNLYFLKLDLENVKTVESLRRVWSKVEHKGLQGEKGLKETYNEKQAMFRKEL